MDRDPALAIFEEKYGIVYPDAVGFMTESGKRNFNIAMDAQPTLSTVMNGSIPAFLTQQVDPKTYKVLFSPMKGAAIWGEEKAGSWTDQTWLFPVTEATGEVSVYNDDSTQGRAGINQAWPQRQSQLFQVMVSYGQLEIERAGLAKLNFVASLDTAAAFILNKFGNLSYHFGIAGLQNYGCLNDPALTAAIAPATKAAGGVKWRLNGALNATALEVYDDVVSLFAELVSQVKGNVDEETPMVLALDPVSAVAFTATNNFNVNVKDLLTKNFPNLTIESSTLYATTGGNVVQLAAKSVEGQDTAYCAFNEKMRSHAIIPDVSSWKQKKTQGTWGWIGRQPFAVATMIGV